MIQTDLFSFQKLNFFPVDKKISCRYQCGKCGVFVGKNAGDCYKCGAFFQK